MTTAKHILRLSLLGLAALSICPAVTTQPNQVFSWSGLCTDCIGTATATLTLTGDYALGSPLNTSHFVSLVYDPTNLILDGFSITQSNLAGISGSIPANLPGAASILIYTQADQFSSQPTGFWCSGNECLADFGTQSSFSSGVPEPATAALVGTGLGIAALVRRRTSARA